MASGRSSEPVGVVTGKVYDKSAGEPLPFANIVIYSLRDSLMVTGTIASENGSFTIEKVPYGRYYIEVKFIGYDKQVLNDIRIVPQKSYIDLGNIQIEPAREQLQEVEVTAERAAVEFHVDKKVVSIQENLNATGESLARALENAPSISVDIDGNVALRGSTSFTVLIDGKPSPLNGPDALQQIPASAVENVEIITNPSAKYDPDGLAGIINIITKKRALDGVSGMINLSAGTRDKYRGDILVNFKSDKVTVYAGADFNDMNFMGKMTKSTFMQSADTAEYILSSGTGDRVRQGYSFKGGLTYHFNKNTSFTFEGSGGTHSFSRIQLGKYHEYTVPDLNHLYYINDNLGSRSEDFYGFTANFEKSFANKDHKLTSYLYFEKEFGGSEEAQEQLFTDENWQEIQVDSEKIKTDEESDEYGLRFQIDYTRPFGVTGKLETGYQARIDMENEDHHFFNFDNETDTWVANPMFTNDVDFRNDIHALYGTYANEFKGFGYQFGIRTEYNFREIQNLNAAAPSSMELFDYFPSVHLSRKIGKQDQVLASYSRRINRPRGFFLDPYPSYMDPNTIRIGNPELLPEYVDSYELSYQKGIGKSSFISLEGYYRKTHNAMTRLTSVRDDGIRVFTMDNLNEENAAGGELMVNMQVTKWLNLNASTNLYLFTLEGNLTDNSVAARSTNSDFRFNGNIRIGRDTRFQVQGFYQGPSVTAQGERKEFLMTSASLRQDFFKQRLSATLRIQDIFKTGNFHFVAEGSNFRDEFRFSREPQVVMLTLGYRINNYKNRDRDGGRGEDSQNGDEIMNDQ
jgi:outer membrane receptor protein involved in Fe transport